jgi:hypothetical protein
MGKQKWIVIGLFVAPLLPAIFGAFTTRIMPDPLPQLNWGLIPIFYSFFLLACTLFGLPAYFLGRRLGLVTWWSALIVGAMIGALFANTPRISGSIQFDQLLILCPLGAATAFLFYVFARRAHL